MSADIAEAKSKLPLPGLMHQLGLGAHAKKKALCPFHDDHRESFSVFKTDKGAWLWKCFTCNSSGDEIEFLRQYENLSNGAAIRRFLKLAGVNDSKPPLGTAFKKTKAVMSKAVTLAAPVPVSPALDWQQCVEAFTEKHLEWLGEWRSYTIEFCSWLKENGLVGLYDGCIAFPIRDEEGDVVAAHYKPKSEDSKWKRHPTGFGTRPIVIGKLLPGKPVHVFESQWDALAFMDKSGERSGIVITLGSSNGALIAGVIPQAGSLYVWPQNDVPGQKWVKDVCAHTKCGVKSAKTPAQFADLNDWTRSGGTDKDLLNAMVNAEVLREPERPLIEFRSPLQLRNFTPPPGLVLLGDFHIVKGSVFVIGGAPGVGKSRASVALAVAGATGSDWFGLKVHCRFKVLIVQTENGEFRLAREFGELDCEMLENFVRVCPPPPYGLCFQRPGFREQLAAAITDFAPECVVYDPWNAAAREQDSREYLDTFDALKSVLPLGDDAPALGIVAHTRKPKTDERASGRALLNLLAGSYVLGSVPRTVFVIQSASDETTDNRIVWTCCKNNDGALGARSAWERRNGLFVPVADFDFDAFDAPDKNKREVISEADVRTIFENGPLSKAEAAKQLEENTGAHRGSCYRTLKLDGRFANHLRATGQKIQWK